MSEQAHYSVARSLQIMGWGAHGAIAVPVDEQFRMRVDELAAARARAVREGRKVIAVVAVPQQVGAVPFSDTPLLDQTGSLNTQIPVRSPIAGVVAARMANVGGTVAAGQAIVVPAGQWVRYSTPAPEGATYVAVCVPAFSPQTVHRDD